VTAWYNEPDLYAAQWLRNLIAAGHIADGVVDTRPIQQIEAYELAGFTQCHFFAGIGVWSAALRRAGWPDDKPIWTGSCPCQPFSNAGKKKGFQDDRHLWPYWKELIGQSRPSVIVGEQVASALDWVDLVSTDLEAAHYAFGAGDICAAGFGGAHIRQRLYFVGLADDDGCGQSRSGGSGIAQEQRITELRGISGMGNGSQQSSERRAGSVFGAQTSVDSQRQFDGCYGDGHSNAGATRGMADSLRDGQQSRGLSIRQRRSEQSSIEQQRGSENRPAHAPLLGRQAVDWLYCRDGKWRPVEPGTFPLVDETPARVGRLRTYGNALDLETASEFCATVYEICAENGI